MKRRLQMYPSTIATTRNLWETLRVQRRSAKPRATIFDIKKSITRDPYAQATSDSVKVHARPNEYTSTLSNAETKQKRDQTNLPPRLMTGSTSCQVNMSARSTAPAS